MAPTTAATPPFAALIATYAGTALYGVAAALTGVLSVSLAYGAVFAQIWPILLALFSLLAILGVRRSVQRDHILLEVITTALYVGFFGVYTLALIVHAATARRPDILPAALLPAIICILPYIRLVRIFSLWIGREK